MSLLSMTYNWVLQHTPYQPAAGQFHVKVPHFCPALAACTRALPYGRYTRLGHTRLCLVRWSAQGEDAVSEMCSNLSLMMLHTSLMGEGHVGAKSPTTGAKTQNSHSRNRCSEAIRKPPPLTFISLWR